MFHLKFYIVSHISANNRELAPKNKRLSRFVFFFPPHPVSLVEFQSTRVSISSCRECLWSQCLCYYRLPVSENPGLSLPRIDLEDSSLLLGVFCSGDCLVADTMQNFLCRRIISHTSQCNLPFGMLKILKVASQVHLSCLINMTSNVIWIELEYIEMD